MESNISTVVENKRATYRTNFIIFCSSRLISDLGSVAFSFALSLYILDITGSPGLFATILSFTMLPGVLVNIFGGVLIDRGDKKKIIILTDLFRGFIVLIFAVIFYFNSKSILIFSFYAIVLSILQAVFSLALNASIPNITSKEDVGKVNSVFQGIGAIIRIIGPLIGAFVYKLTGMQFIIIADGISFLIAGILRIFIMFDKNCESSGEKTGYLKSLREVYSYINGRAGLNALLVTSFLSSLVFGALIDVGLPYISYNKLGMIGVQVSLVLAAGSIGMIIGAVIISMKSKGNILFKKILLFFQIESGLTILWVFPLTPFMNDVSKWVITGIFCLLIALTGIFASLVSIPALGYLQTSTPEKIRASVLGVVNTLAQVATPIGMWGYGMAFEKINWGYVVVFPIVILIIVIALMGRNKSLKEFFNTV